MSHTYVIDAKVLVRISVLVTADSKSEARRKVMSWDVDERINMDMIRPVSCGAALDADIPGVDQ